ncbi:MAG: glycosyltransferase family 39 protein [Planctomycetaceae bacterium]
MGSILGRKPLLCILLGAFLLRAALAVALQSHLDSRGEAFLIAGDAEGYWHLGRQIAAGKPYEIYQPPRQVLRMPGFPAELAVAMKLAAALRLDPMRAYFVARLFQAVIGTLCCYLVFLLGRDLFDRRIGLIAAGIVALLPTLASFSVELLSETPFAALLVASLVALGRVVRNSAGEESRTQNRSSTILWAIASGVLIALACYVRPSWLLFAPCFALLYLLVARGAFTLPFRAAVGLVVVASTFLTLAPWAYRNYRATGHAVFTTLWAGPSLYDGLRADATGDSDMRFYETDPNVPRMTEYEVDRYFRAKAWEFVRQNPARAVELAFIKLWRFWKPWPNAAQFGGVLYTVVVAVSFVPLLVLAMCGAWSARARFWPLFLTAGPILYFSALHMVFVSSLRYRLPVEYPLAVLSAVGVEKFFGRGNRS